MNSSPKTLAASQSTPLAIGWARLMLAVEREGERADRRAQAAACRVQRSLTPARTAKAPARSSDADWDGEITFQNGYLMFRARG